MLYGSDGIQHRRFTMPDTPSDFTHELTYTLNYDGSSGTIANQDFRGVGTLTINSAGPSYTFAGKPRAWFGPKTNSLLFHATDITNVEVVDRAVQFKTSLGKSGKRQTPFTFHLKDAAEARTVANLLPLTFDAEFTEGRDFITKLETVAGPQSAVASPTNIIIALNLVAFVLMGSLGAGWFEVESMMPYILYGANNGAATTDGEWWRLLTSMFMHYGILHLVLNMWALFQAGHFMEKMLGRASYLLAYFASGLVGGLASLCWYGDRVWSAGASGAVFGVYGMILGYMLREKQAIPRSIYQSMLKSTLTFAGYNILYGLAKSGIDNAAHVGGFLGGIAFGWLLALPLETTIRARLTGRRLQLGLVVLAAVMALGITLSPRFDYRIPDVLAWEESNRDFIRDEPALLKQHAQYFNALNDTTEHETYADWIETKFIPFYENWQHRLTALQLAPDKATVHTRDSLVHVFQLRAESLRHLTADLRAHDPDAALHFNEEDAVVDAALTKLQGSAAN